MKIEVYTKDNCIYCVKTKDLLKNHNYEFDEYKMGDTITRDQIVSTFPGWKTLPIIVIDGKFIGGFTDLEKWIKDNNEG